MGITFKLSSEIWNVKRGRKANITLQCVVPGNIQTPTTEGISLRTAPPQALTHLSGFAIFAGYLRPPTPSGISTSETKTPRPLWKGYVEEYGHLWLVCNGFHQKLVCFCFHLFE